MSYFRSHYFKAGYFKSQFFRGADPLGNVSGIKRLVFFG